MYKVLLWGAGIEYCNLINLIKRYEQEGQFEVSGVVYFDAFDTSMYDEYFSYMDGYPLVHYENVTEAVFDYIIICGNENEIRKIRQYLISVNVPEDVIISGFVLRIPGFSFDKYIELYKSRLSILSMNCYGGVAYKYLGLKVRSPFYNMFVDVYEFVDFLYNAKEIMTGEKLVFQDMIETGVKPPYPHFKLADLNIYMNHYTDRDDAEKKWYERLARVNWDNLFVTIYANDPKLVKRFSELPYEKKMCFTSNEEINLPSTFYLPQGSLQLWDAANRTVNGMRSAYDVIHLMLTGEAVTRLEPPRILKTAVIIFLSKYNKELIDYYKSIYSGKFTDIFFSCPWYTGDDAFFSEQLYSMWYGNAYNIVMEKISEDYDIYIFQNEEGVINTNVIGSLLQEFNNSGHNVGISYIGNLYAPNFFKWYWMKHVLYPFVYSAKEWQKYLLPFEKMMDRMTRHFKYYDKYFNDAFFGVTAFNEETEEIKNFKKFVLSYPQIPYPLAVSAGGADCVIVKKEKIAELAEQFRAWSAVGVFCETAIPTAILSVCAEEEIMLLNNYVNYRKQDITDDTLVNKYKCRIESAMAENNNCSFLRVNMGLLLKGDIK